jgi:hypothetical protein
MVRSGDGRIGRSRLVGDLLLACLSSRPGRELPADAISRISEQDLLRAVRLHDVAGSVLATLRQHADIPAAWLAGLQAEADRAALVELRAHADLPGLALALSGVTDRWTLVKGPAIAARYPAGCNRSGHDLDVVIPPSALSTTLDQLTSIGCELIGDAWPELQRTERAQLTIKLPHGSVLDLHWHLFNNPGVRQSFAVDMSALLDRARSVVLLGTPVRTFDPADTLMHVAAHAVLAGGFRLKWVKDIDVLVTQGAAWPELVQRSKESRLGLPVAVMLERAHRLLRTPIPPGLSRQLSSASGWRHAIGVVERVAPPHRATRPVATGTVVVSATRATTAASVAQLSRSLRTSVVLPLVRNKQHPWRAPGERVPVAPPTRLLTESPHERDAFVRWVGKNFAL